MSQPINIQRFVIIAEVEEDVVLIVVMLIEVDSTIYITLDSTVITDSLYRDLENDSSIIFSSKDYTLYKQVFLNMSFVDDFAFNFFLN